MDTEDKELVLQIMQENRDGLQRLAAEHPAQERKTPLYRLKKFVLQLIADSPQTGTISVN